jgi:outer membrane protein assembly factor BamB
MHRACRFLPCLVLLASLARAQDWPQWRYDAGRSAVTPAELPGNLHLQWARTLPAPAPAWPTNQVQLQFDASYEPIVAGKTLFVPSMASDGLSAFDTDTGTPKWHFFADGPIRFAPVAWHGKVFFACDDGHLYALNAASGALLWKVRGGPSERKILGNDRLASLWPARGGPVLLDGTIYFTAGIWPFMGIFIHAVDAETGRILWTNSGSGALWKLQGHSSPAFAGIAPQGYLAAEGNRLLVPGGRTAPAALDRLTGERLYFSIIENQLGSGGYEVQSAGDYFLNGGALHRSEDGAALLRIERLFLTPASVYQMKDKTLVAAKLVVSPPALEKTPPALPTATLVEQWRASLRSAPERIMLQAGTRLYGSSADGTILAIDLKSRDVIWKDKVNGVPWSMLAADGKLWVVTRAGVLYCFGAQKKVWPKRHAEEKVAAASVSRESSKRARQLLRAAGTDSGVILVLGLTDGNLIQALANSSQSLIIGVDPDPRKIETLRQQFVLQGLYGRRIHLLAGDPAIRDFPPYLASLIATEQPDDPAAPAPGIAPAEVFRVLRPYGGTLCLPAMPVARDAVSRARAAGGLEQAVVTEQEGLLLLSRAGPLPGAANWTHEYADAAGTATSTDKLVAAPMGPLWFGGPSHDAILPRHGHGPSPQVAGGRLFIEGRHTLRAIDVYTGRLLWDRELEDLGKFYDNTQHQPGAGEVGGNYVSLPDAVYVVTPRYCLGLDPATGRTVRDFKLPSFGSSPTAWGSIRVWQDLLVATTAPLSVPTWDIGDVPPENTEPVIARGEEWRYWTGARPAATWILPDFGATGWPTGRAGFGTAYEVATDLGERCNTVYMRRAFDVAATGEIARLDLLIRYDDAFVAYLNGQEVLRTQVANERSPAGPKVGRHEARSYEQFEIRDAGKWLRPGRNVLAVEGYNTTPADDDFVIDPYLVVQRQDAAPGAPVAAVPLGNVAGVDLDAEYSSASRTLVVISRETGKVAWTRAARQEFRHNTVVVGAGKIFCIDGLSAAKAAYLRRRGHPVAGEPVLLALDARTGRELWRQERGVTGTWLSYSEEHDALLEASARGRDRPQDEAVAGMAVFQGSDGKPLWRDDTLLYTGPCMLRHDRIITQERAYELLTGKPCLRTHPLTGKSIPWGFKRNYGCGTARAGENLLTFRSAAAGFFDLINGGTGNFGGFRSGCTANLIPADGLLNAPDYTRTCVCRYQIQTSLALVHMPEAEKWTFDDFGDSARELPEIHRVGINFGAPGDRQAENGSLWLGYPNAGWPSPNVSVTTAGMPAFFTRHTSVVTGALPWVGASGMEGATSVTVRLLLRPPVAIVGRDFSARWEGLLQPSETGRHTFHVQAKDGFRLWIEKRLLLDFWSPRWFTAAEAAMVELEAGKPVAFLLEYVNRGGAPSLSLSWKPPSGSKGELPPSCFTSVAGTSGKMTATYFDQQNLTGRNYSREESGVPHDWNKKVLPALFALRGEPATNKVYSVSPGTVRLYFAEPRSILPGARVFDVWLQGKNVQKDLDVVQEAGAPNRMLVKEYAGIPLGGELRVTFIPKAGQPLLCGLEIIKGPREATGAP